LVFGGCRFAVTFVNLLGSLMVIKTQLKVEALSAWKSSHKTRKRP